MNAVVIGLFFLACGWKFYKDFKYTRYIALQNSGHPQYFGGALCAAFIFVVCLCLDTTASKVDFYNEVTSQIVASFPSISDLSARDRVDHAARIALWAIPVVWVLTKILNAPLHKSPNLLLAIARKTRIVDELEDTLYYCLERGLMVLVTLKSKKVYVGIPKRHSPDPDRDRVWLAIWPVASGFRDEEGSITFTTFYPDFDLLAQETAGKRTRNDFQLVVPISEIAVVQSFDMESFNKFSTENDVLTKSPQPAASTSGVVSGQENQLVSVTASNETVVVDSVTPADHAEPSAFESLSSEIINRKDKYYLRCYNYFVGALFLGIVFLPYAAWMALLLLVVSAVSAIESIKPLVLRIEHLKEQLNNEGDGVSRP